MKNLKSCLFIGLSLLMTATSLAQSHFNILNAKTPDEIGKVPVERQIADQDTPLTYWHIDDRDVLWSKIVWEHIDLNQRINLPLYFPI
ncbi:MAG: gliding motility protein GldN, partial [Flavicella sp.]|nr:gliding motility protein GldN [Flavicella sp.]